MTVMWKTSSSASGQVEYGLTDSYGDSKSSANGTLHQVDITGLQPNTKYFYKVTSDGDSKSAFFRTFPNNTTDKVVFGVIGDPKYYVDWGNREDDQELGEWIATNEPHFVIHVGDFVKDGESLTHSYWQMFFDYQSELLARAPVYIAVGNHEYSGSGNLSPGYKDNFIFPENGPESEIIYSFDCGKVHVAVGDIHNRAPSTDYNYYGAGSPQHTFITNDVVRSDAQCKVIVFHHPVYSSGGRGVSDNTSWAENILADYVPTFLDNDVSLFLSGHDHAYERSEANGITYSINSSASGSEGDGTHDSHSKKSAANGASVFVVEGNSINATAAKTKHGFAIIETYSITLPNVGPSPEINIKQGTTALPDGSGEFDFGEVAVGSNSEIKL